MRPVSLEEVVRAITVRRSLPTHAVLVTFDDGDRSVLDVAAPILVEAGVPGVACVITSVLDTEDPFWWDEVVDLWQAGGRSVGSMFQDAGHLIRLLKRLPDEQRHQAIQELRSTASSPARPRAQLKRDELAELEAAGIEVANHTMTHPCLPNCQPDAVDWEVRTAHETLRSIVGHAPRAFAYPNGDWDERADSVLRELGYEVGFLFDHRIARVSQQDQLRISRLRVDDSASLDRFAILVSGLHSSIHRLRGLN